MSRLIAAAILAGLSLVPYFVETLGVPERVQKVEIVKSETPSQSGVVMHLGNGDDENAESAAGEREEAETSPPEAPEGPPIDVIREDGSIRYR